MARYKSEVYAMADLENYRKFTRSPKRYVDCDDEETFSLGFAIKSGHINLQQVEDEKRNSLADYKELLLRGGDFEQYLHNAMSDVIRDGLKLVGKERVVHHLLEPKTSATMLLSLYLKANNPNMSDKRRIRRRQEALRNFLKDCQSGSDESCSGSGKNAIRQLQSVKSRFEANSSL